MEKQIYLIPPSICINKKSQECLIVVGADNWSMKYLQQAYNTQITYNEQKKIMNNPNY